MIERIKHLVMMGFAVHRLHPQTKRPVGDDWSNRKVATYAELKQRYRDGENVGVRLGKWSKIDGLYLHAIDMDVRVPEAAADAEAALEDLFPGVKVWKLPRVISGSGGASRHIYFVTDEPFPSKKLVTSGKKFTDKDGRKHWTWELELFGTGKQVAMPPSIHPDTGLPYRWDREFDPTAKPPIIDGDLIARLVYGEDEDVGYDNEVMGISYEEAKEYLKDLDLNYWCEDRVGWITLGMALHHEFDGSDDAYDVWCNFSKQSKKFDLEVCEEQWGSIKDKTERPVTFRTIVRAANEFRHAEIYDAIPDEFDDVGEADATGRGEKKRERPTIDVGKKLKGVPKQLLSIPGDLQSAVDYYNATAYRPQPQFAVQAALALGSVVLSRFYCTDQNNYSSLYFILVGESSAGKEHVKTVIEEILEEADEGEFIGPKSYTSEAGVFSSLMANPRQISVPDEFGKYLHSARMSGNAHKADVQTIFMEAFGRLNGVLRPTGYSTHGMNDEQAKGVKNRKVRKPGLSILGMTTPSTFFSTLGPADIKDGFLNRLLIVETPIGRQVARRVPHADVPRKIIDWIKEHAWKTDDPDDEMAGVRAKMEPTYIPDPVVIPFTAECNEMLDGMDIELYHYANDLDDFDLGDMTGRTREIAMRVALIVAVSDRSTKVRRKHLEWARDYVFFYHRQFIERIKLDLGKTEIETVTDDVLRIIERAGDNGKTEREIVKACRPYKRLNTLPRSEVLSRLKTDHGVRFVDIKSEDGNVRRGAKRRAYVAPKKRKKGER